MVIPFIFLAIGATTGASGLAMGLHSSIKINDLKSYKSEAYKIQKNALDRLKLHCKKAVLKADELGLQEMKIIETFRVFSDYIEEIQERPVFDGIQLSSFKLDSNGLMELRKMSNNVALLMGTAGSMAIGVAGGFAAAGAATSAISVLGTASSDTVIANLSGAAATNATFAALGGGSLATGGGGIAFEFIAEQLSDSADLAMVEAKKTEYQVRKLINFFDELSYISNIYGKSMSDIANKYFKHLHKMIDIIKNKRYCHWSNFNEEEKSIVKNTILYVNILYNMCRVQITKDTDKGLNIINRDEIKKMLEYTEKYIA